MNVYLQRLRALSEKPPVQELPKLPKPPKGGCDSGQALVQELPKLPKGAYGSYGSTTTARIPEIDAATTPTLPDLLARHGDASAGAVRWDTLALTDAAASALWVVLAPRGLTVLATTTPIHTPLSYAAAWPARWVTPEPVADAATARAEHTAADAIGRAMQSCWACRHLDTLARLQDRTPHCAAGHALVWRVIHPGRRTTPSRARDPTRACPDRTPPANPGPSTP